MLVLDTHAVVWVSFDSSRLSKKAARAIENARAKAGGLFISSITLCELATLIVRNRLGLHISLESFLEEVEARFTILPINRHIAARSVQLPTAYPKDPIDRIIGATALVEGLPLVTADEGIRKSNAVNTIW